MIVPNRSSCFFKQAFKNRIILNCRRSSKPAHAAEPSSGEFEEDQQVIQRRAKQLDYGKNTDGYKRYNRNVQR